MDHSTAVHELNDLAKVPAEVMQWRMKRSESVKGSDKRKIANAGLRKDMRKWNLQKSLKDQQKEKEKT